MAADLGSAYLQIVPSMKGFGSAVAKEVGGSGGDAGKQTGERFKNGFSGAISGMGKLVGAGLALAGIGAVGGLLKDSIGYASDLNEAGTATQAVFGKATDQVNAFASKGPKALGQTSLEVLNAAKTFGVYGKAAGLASGANAGFSTDLVGLSTDLASFYNTSPADAIEAIGAGLRGESEPLRKYGILLDDATLKAQAMSMGIYKGNGPLTNQQKILAAQASIMKQSTIAQGDFTKTSGGLANQQRILAASFTTVKGNVGAALLPMVNFAVKGINGLLTPLATASAKLPAFAAAAKGAVGDFLDGFSAVPGSVGASLAGAYGGFAGFGAKVKVAFLTIRDTVGAVLDTIGPIISSTFGGIAAAVGPSIGPLASAFGQIGQAMLGLLPALSPVGLIFKALLPVLPTLAGLLAQVAGVIGGALAQAAAIVVPLIGTLVGILSGVFVAIMPVVVQLVGALVAAFTQIMPVVLGVVAALAPLIVSLVSQLAPIIVQLVSSVLPPLIQAFSGIIAAAMPLITMIAGLLIPIIKAILPVVIAVFSAIVPVIQAAIQIVVGVINVLLGILTGNWSQVWNGLVGIVSGVWNLIVGVIKGAIGIVLSVIGAVLSIIGTLFAAGWNLLVGIVRNVWNLIVGAVTAYINTLMSNIRAGLSIVTSIWNGAWKAITGFIKAAWTLIVNAVKTGVDTVIGFVKGIPGKAVAVLSNLGKTLFNSGKALIQGFIDGIKDMLGAVGKVAGDVVGTIAKFFPSSPAKKGPFSGKGWTPYRGKALALGFAEGMNAGTRPVEVAANGLMSAASISGATASIAANTAAPAGAGSGAGAGFPGKVTLIDSNGSLLGHMDARIDRYDLSQQLAGAR